ncbi:thiamine phosphate synthase [Flavobacterium sp. Arc2]|jgi:thiamine-phosphate pyrophosphorylase|uniref:thiamine phosphate synthase n=1 Tax=Flavobacterium sp. Arc2 TaxID=3046685 RepID=UPI00352FED1F
MIVITNPISTQNETNTIHALFECGLELLHVRKPYFSEEEMKVFLSKVTKDYNSRLVLHQHHQLALDFGINRIHLTESTRATWKLGTEKKRDQFIKSTSTHVISDFNQLDDCFEYAFLSPIYQSISKPDYQSNFDIEKAIKDRTNFNTKLFALGGISHKNIENTYQSGFDDVALLGIIWNTNQPIQNFKLCQKIAHLY